MSFPKISPIISVFVCFLFFIIFSVSPVGALETGQANQTFRPGDELQKMKTVRAHLMKINKPAIKTIQSPDGDIIDCVLSHKQPAFDHPQLKGQKPLDPPERPKGHNKMSFFLASENFQLWSLSGESCPEGTVPIRRTSEQDVLRASSISEFGRKIARPVIRDSSSNDGHEHAVGYVSGDQYYGAKASINVWAPVVANQYEFSLSQIWIISGSFGDDLNTIEAGWQDPKHGNWWLEFGSGVLVGYWPSFLFTHLRTSASMMQFGGEVVNSMPSGSHTSTQMGSGHFAGEGFGKASYFRNLQLVDWDNSLIPLSNLQVLADHPNCYDIQAGSNRVWGNFFYYGGPGKSPKCP
nr:uncharacterized protein LOC107814626 [Ipomoea batatas]